MQPLLRLESVCKVFRAAGVQTTALDRVDLTLGRPEFVALMGPSGSGKTTLLNAIGLLEPVTSGRIVFEGTDTTGLGEAARARLRRTQLGFVFQGFNLVDELTVQDNIELPLAYQGIGRAERARRCAEALERLGIAHRARHRPAQLSGGQQQRVAIARALVTHPRLFLADEPAGNLDSVHGREVIGLLRGLAEGGASVLMATHSEEHAAAADRIVTMRDGRVIDSMPALRAHRVPPACMNGAGQEQVLNEQAS
jgi:putative ABC transport system ATP-binding protein